MAKRNRQESVFYSPMSPLAKQSPGGLNDYYTESVVNKPLSKRGITKFSPETTTKALAYSNAESIKDVLTVAFDKPDFNMLKLRPRYDGQAHRIPEGDGVTKRKRNK